MRKTKTESMRKTKWKSKELSNVEKQSVEMNRWRSRTHQQTSKTQRYNYNKRIKVVIGLCRTLLRV